ncbi:MAG: toxic anion resistance protein [Muricoprocola sp.]
MSDEFTKLAGEVPTLTLDPFGQAQAVQEKAEEVLEEAKKEETPEERFSEEEKAAIEAFASQINIKDNNMILQYGAGAQQKLADFSEKALDNVKTQELGEVGEMLASVVTELQSFDVKEEKKGGIFGLFKKGENKVDSLKAKYEKTEANIDKICEGLEEHQVQLMKDTALLDQMYEMNLAYFKELSMYIAAGKKKLEEVRKGELAQLIKKAEESGLQEDAQEAKDLGAYCDRFEKKLYDLELSRTISMQTAPQLRLIQDNNTLMVEKIQSTLVNTIPLWKNQMVIALGLEHAQNAAKAQNAVSAMTNELLKKNAEALHEATVATARESERGVVDIETLKETNEKLVQTFDEVLKIQDEGREKRLQAEADMVRMESELKAKLLQIKK